MKFKELLATAALSLFSINASASVISGDYSAGGDGLLSIDTTNNMEWLDVSSTVNQSVTQALATYNAAGFRLATASELVDLYVSAGIDSVLDYNYGFSNPIAVVGTPTTAYYNVTSVAGKAAAASLHLMMGWTSAAFYGNPWIHGYLADHDGDTRHALGRFRMYESEFAVHVNTNLDQWGQTEPSESVGSFLVRSTGEVPAPAPLALLGIGALAFGFTRRKKAV